MLTTHMVWDVERRAPFGTTSFLGVAWTLGDVWNLVNNAGGRNASGGFNVTDIKHQESTADHFEATTMLYTFVATKRYATAQELLSSATKND